MTRARLPTFAHLGTPERLVIYPFRIFREVVFDRYPQWREKFRELVRALCVEGVLRPYFAHVPPITLGLPGRCARGESSLEGPYELLQSHLWEQALEQLRAEDAAQRLTDKGS